MLIRTNIKTNKTQHWSREKGPRTGVDRTINKVNTLFFRNLFSFRLRRHDKHWIWGYCLLLLMETLLQNYSTPHDCYDCCDFLFYVIGVNRRSLQPIPYWGYWCPGEDSNFHDLRVTGTWSQRVYQFRHLGTFFSTVSWKWVLPSRDSSCNHASVKPF